MVASAKCGSSCPKNLRRIDNLQEEGYMNTKGKGKSGRDEMVIDASGRFLMKGGACAKEVGRVYLNDKDVREAEINVLAVGVLMPV